MAEDEDGIAHEQNRNPGVSAQRNDIRNTQQTLSNRSKSRATSTFATFTTQQPINNVARELPSNNSITRRAYSLPYRVASNLRNLGDQARIARKTWDRSKDILSDGSKLMWTPHLSVLLAGLDDDSSALCLLRGHEYSLLKHIYSYAISFIKDNWKSMVSPGYKQYVHNTIPGCFVGEAKIIDINMAREIEAKCDDTLDYGLNVQNVSVHVDPLVSKDQDDDEYLTHMTVYGPRYSEFMTEEVDIDKVKAIAAEGSKCAFTRCGAVSFPPPSDIDINMMPFIMGDKESLPEYLQKYYDPLVAKCPISTDEIGKVCFISITERYIEKGTTQRRGGLHIEAPVHQLQDFSPGGFIRARWGMGVMKPDSFKGGIYMASNVSNSCAVWDALIGKSSTDSHGGMEHLRPLLNNP